MRYLICAWRQQVYHYLHPSASDFNGADRRLFGTNASLPKGLDLCTGLETIAQVTLFALVS
jgi:hypothetical protein